MRVFHIAGTRSTRVVWALEETGAPYELAVITGEERKSDEHRQRHPLGRVPAVELDDGTFMFESAAICMYIADLHPESRLMPTGTGTDRALAYQWVVFVMAELERTLFAWLSARYKEEDEAPHMTAFKQVEQALGSAISGKTWLVGETFTVPDLLCANTLAAGLGRQVIDTTGPLGEYVARAQARPAYERANAAGR